MLKLEMQKYRKNSELVKLPHSYSNITLLFLTEFSLKSVLQFF